MSELSLEIMSNNPIFKELFDQAIHTIRAQKHQTIKTIEDDIGYAIGRETGGSPISYWRRGYPPANQEDLEKLALELVQRARLDRKWLCAFLRQGNHPDPERVCQQQFNIKTNASSPQATTEHPTHAPAEESESNSTSPRLHKQSNSSHPLSSFSLTNILPILLLLALLLAVSYGLQKSNPIHTGWVARAYPSDDIAIVLVNGQIVTDHKANIWTDLTPFLHEDDQPNIVTLIGINGPSQGDWQFELQYQQDRPYSLTDNTGESFSSHILGRFQLHSGGQLTELPIPTYSSNATWAVQLQAADYAVLLVNGVPATAVYNSPSGQFNGKDVSRYFNPNGPNEVSLLVQSNGGAYHWNATLYRDGKIVWESADHGRTLRKGIVNHQIFTIDSSELTAIFP